MGVRVTVSEYLTAPRPKQSHALSPVLPIELAQAYVAVSFERSDVVRVAKYRPHFRGALPQWPNLIGRAALPAYMQALPVASSALSQDVRTVGHRACLVGLGVGLSVAWITSDPNQLQFWCLAIAIALVAYQGARLPYYHCHKADARRIEQLLTLSCLAVRGYLGEFGEIPPLEATDLRLDVQARDCLQALTRASDAVSCEALRQYTQWAEQYRYRTPPQEMPPPPASMPPEVSNWP